MASARRIRLTSICTVRFVSTLLFIRPQLSGKQLDGAEVVPDCHEAKRSLPQARVAAATMLRASLSRRSARGQGRDREAVRVRALQPNSDEAVWRQTTPTP